MFDFFQLGIIVKLLMTAVALLYLVFVAVIYRQIVLMTGILQSNVSPVVKMVAAVQVVVVGVLVLVTLIFA